jgi:hypothetical protein
MERNNTQNEMFNVTDKFNRFTIAGELSNANVDISSKRRFGVGCCALLEAFSERTTSHGLPHMYHARGNLDAFSDIPQLILNLDVLYVISVKFAIVQYKH